jgi:superoxide dismutase, Fe-Mn family
VAFELPPLPFAKDALASRGMSEETLEYHYGKHHKTYVNNLNGLVEGTEHADDGLEQIIKAPRPTPRCSTTPPRCGTTPSSGTA